MAFFPFLRGSLARDVSRPRPRTFHPLYNHRDRGSELTQPDIFVRSKRSENHVPQEGTEEWSGQEKDARPEDVSPLMNLQIPYNVVLCTSGCAGFRWKPHACLLSPTFLRAISLPLSLFLSLTVA